MNKKILIIDDTKNIRKMIKKCLESNGFEVITAENGYEGIKLFKENKIDLVILDIRMPQLSGTEVLKIIKNINGIVPILIITAFPTIKNAVECMKLGAIDYLRKPFTPDRIRETIEKIIKRRTADKGDISSYESLIEYSKKLISERKFDDALHYLKESISLSIEDGEPFNLLGMIYEINKDYLNARKYYNIAIQLNPDCESITQNLDRINKIKYEEK